MHDIVRALETDILEHCSVFRCLRMENKFNSVYERGHCDSNKSGRIDKIIIESSFSESLTSIEFKSLALLLNY